MSREKTVMRSPITGGFHTLFMFRTLQAICVAMIAMLSFPFLAAADAQAGQISKMVVLGDSLVAGYGLGPGEAFPEKLQAAAAKAGLEIIVENAGVSGDTTSGGLARLDWSVSDDTDLVLIELGANDALRGISPEVSRQNIEAIITRLRQRDIHVMLAGMLAPPNMGEEYGSAFNAIYPELAEKHDVPLYPFFLDGVAAERDLNQPDGIHPTAEGIDVIVERFLPFMKSSLAHYAQP